MVEVTFITVLLEDTYLTSSTACFTFCCCSLYTGTKSNLILIWVVLKVIQKHYKVLPTKITICDIYIKVSRVLIQT